MARRRKKSRRHLEKFLQEFLERRDRPEYAPTDFEVQILDKIEGIYDEFSEKVLSRSKELTANQKMMLSNWARILGRELPQIS